MPQQNSARSCSEEGDVDVRNVFPSADAVRTYLTNTRGIVTTEEMQTLLLSAGRVEGPGLLAYAWWLRRIETATLTSLVSDVWSDAEYPQRSLRADDWRDLFSAAGFTIDGKAADRPTEPVRLYRGSPKSMRRRWSWTSSVETAERFATGRLRGRQLGQVWTVLAPPDVLLCVCGGRDEREHVIDTRGLKIVGAPAVSLTKP